MKLKLKRIRKNSNYTEGKLYVNDAYLCDTLEDTDRGLNDNMSLELIKAKKIYGLTAIPLGTYKVDMNTVSTKYSNPKYKWAKEINAKVPRLINVKGYEGVLIHPGNTPKDTYGCILVGLNASNGFISNSVNTFKLLYSILQDHKNEEITIEIK